MICKKCSEPMCVVSTYASKPKWACARCSTHKRVVRYRSRRVRVHGVLNLTRG